LNITPEKDLTCCRCHCRHFLRKEAVVTIATVTNDFGSQLWQWWGQATVVETEAAAVAHNNQPTKGSDMSAEMAFTLAAAATATAVAAAVATVAMVATVAAQMAAAETGLCEIYIKNGQKWRSWPEAAAATATMAPAATAVTVAVAAAAATAE